MPEVYTFALFSCMGLIHHVVRPTVVSFDCFSLSGMFHVSISMRFVVDMIRSADYKLHSLLEW